MILFWLGVIFILAFVCIIFYQTLKRNNTQFDENADLNFYKSQLSEIEKDVAKGVINSCLLYTSPSPRDQRGSGMAAYA